MEANHLQPSYRLIKSAHGVERSNCMIHSLYLIWPSGELTKIISIDWVNMVDETLKYDKTQLFLFPVLQLAGQIILFSHKPRFLQTIYSDMQFWQNQWPSFWDQFDKIPAASWVCQCRSSSFCPRIWVHPECEWRARGWHASPVRIDLWSLIFCIRGEIDIEDLRDRFKEIF